MQSQLESFETRVADFSAAFGDKSRTGMQRFVDLVPELKQLKAAIEAEQKVVRSKVDRGELPGQAWDVLFPIWQHTCEMVNTARNTYAVALLNSCPCPDLREQFAIVSRAERDATRRLTELTDEAASLTRQADSASRIAEALREEKRTAKFIDEMSKRDHEKELDRAERNLEHLTKSESRAKSMLADARQHAAELADQVETVKAAMRAA